MGAVATFSAGEFESKYPAFATASEAALQNCFDIACLYWPNDGSGPVADAGQQKLLLYLLTAHIATLQVGADGERPSGIVGRVSSATEGSVSVSAEMPGLPLGAAWYAQSSYGLTFWQLTLPYRTARYIPSPGRNFAPGIVGRQWLP